MHRSVVIFDRFGRISDEQPADDVDQIGDDLGELVHRAGKRSGFVWLRLIDPEDQQLEQLGTTLGLHPLVLQDVSSGRQQPKVQRYDDHLFILLWDLQARHDRQLTLSQTFVLLSHDWLVTVQESGSGEPADLGDAPHDRGEAGDGPLGAAYAIMADVTTRYSRITSDIEDELEAIEADVFDPERREDVRSIYRVRKNIGLLDRAVSSLAASLEAGRDHLGEFAVDHERTEPFLQHLIDGIAGTAAMTDDQSRSLDAVVSSHESNVASRQNQDMRTITAFAALLAMPTLIAGIYGMNFPNLPPIRSGIGWIVIIVAMVAVDVLTYLVFKRRRWI